MTKTKARRYVLIASFIILIIVSIQEPLLEAVERDLGTHMIIEHAIFFLLGALSVIVLEILLRALVLYAKKNKINNISGDEKDSGNSNGQYTGLIIIDYWSMFLRKIFFLNRDGIWWLTIAVILMAIWHIPAIFDFASINDFAHIIQHFSFIIVGACGYLAMRIIRELFNIILLFSLIGMMGFAGLTLTVLDSPVYVVYSLSSHNNAGAYMIILSIVLALIIFPAYLIQRTIFHLRVISQQSKDDK